jgi:hypothetical protein
MSSKSRFLAFGCSYTNWKYSPTWADFIGINYDKYYNFGKPGASNTYIMQKLIEADTICNLNSETDFVMVALTGFGRFTYLTMPEPKQVGYSYNWETHGDILFQNEGHPTIAKLIRDKIYNFPWAAYDSWMAVTIIKQLLTLKGIEHKIIMALDNSHYVNEAYTLELNYKFDNIGHIVPKIKDIYNMLDTDISIGNYREENMGAEGTLYPNDNPGNHPSKEVYYDYCMKYLPELLSDKSLDLLNTPNEIWKSKFNNLI